MECETGVSVCLRLCLYVLLLLGIIFGVQSIVSSPTALPLGVRNNVIEDLPCSCVQDITELSRMVFDRTLGKAWSVLTATAAGGVAVWCYRLCGMHLVRVPVHVSLKVIKLFFLSFSL